MAMPGLCAVEASAPVSEAQVVSIARELSGRPSVETVVVAWAGRRPRLAGLDVSVGRLPPDERPVDLVAASLPPVTGRCVLAVRAVGEGYEVAASGWDPRTPWELMLVPSEPAVDSEPPPVSAPVSTDAGAPAPADEPAPSP